MDLHKLFIVLVDISGYTRFITAHKTSLLHAEKIITELMESVIDTSDNPLIVNKLEGDAALFYALSDGTPAAAKDILGQVRRFFDAFYKRESEMVEFNMCSCEGCMQMGQLDLKAIIHHGEAAIKKVRQFEELAGPDVILAHRLLKNSIAKKEYILMTEPFFALSGGLPGEVVQQSSEQCEGIGKVSVRVQYPVHKLNGAPALPPEVQLRFRWNKLPQILKLQGHALVRALGIRKQPEFRNLPAT
jgi:hypothetical protein